jgi:hypothetical protein
MSLSQQLVKQLENTLDLYIDNIAQKYNLDRDELLQLWSGDDAPAKPSRPTNVAKAVRTPKTPLEIVDTDDISPERLLKCNKAELSALCKSHGKKCTGKKEELIARLRETTPGPVTSKKAAVASTTKAGSAKAAGTKAGSAKAARATESHAVIKKLMTNVLAVPVRSNAYGNLEHPETRLVFNKTTKKVCGKQEDDGKVSDLTDDDIENCKRFKFPYDVPSNLDKKGNSEKVQIEELDDVVIEDDDVVEDDDAAEEEVEEVALKGDGDDDEDVEEDADEVEEDEDEE